MENFRLSDTFIKACRIGDKDAIKQYILENPSLLEVSDTKHGWTALYRTVMCGNTLASEFLLSLGANCNSKDKNGYSLIFQAINNSQIKEAHLLLDYQAEINAIQPDGNTCLHAACEKDSVSLVKSLLEKGADPNIKNSVNGKTPLHIAVENTSADTIKILLKFNANPGLKDNFGRSATELAKPELKLLFHSHFKPGTPDRSPRSSPLFVLPEVVEEIPSIPVESFNSLSLSPVSTQSKMILDNFDKQCSTYIESEKNEKHLRAFSFGGNATSLFIWLESVRLEFLYEVLMSGGFDDIDQMVSQMNSNFKITEEMLESIRINKPGYRKRLLAALDEEARNRGGRRHRQTQSNPLKCCYIVDPCQGGITSAADLKQWLEAMKCGQYYEAFIEAGYEDLEHNLCLMNSKWPINDLVLQNEIRIPAQTHRFKLISKLKNESFGFDSLKKIPGRVRDGIFFDRNKETLACELCIVM